MRLFAGIAIAPHVLDNLARVLEELRPLAPLNWAPVENLHITSKFIGEWPDERLTELESALEDVTVEDLAKTPESRGGFEVTIARFGYLPNPHNPRILVAGVQANPALAALARKIEDKLVPLGVARETRPYLPHLTLARIKQESIRDLREHIANMTNFDFGTFQVSEFHLYLSQPGPKASVYTPLAVYPFRVRATFQMASPTGSPE